MTKGSNWLSGIISGVIIYVGMVCLIANDMFGMQESSITNGIIALL